MERISPELALVDQHLDTTARRALPQARDCLDPQPEDASRASVTKSPADRINPAVLGMPVLLAAAAVAILALTGGVGSETDNHTPAAAAAVRAADAETAKQRSIAMRWRPVRDATFYNVIFWQNGARALDLWPTTASVRLPRGRLAPGTYQWFVYPAFGTGDARRYGRVIAQGRLRI